MNEEKFSGKAEIYDKYRPTYPTALINVLYNEIHGDENSRVADIGAGTGIFTKALLGKFRNVTAVEPNGDMYSVLRANLPDITAVQNSAENTGLPQSSFDLITTAQAFHWFDKDMFRNECKRILKPNGKLAVIWNRRVRNDFGQGVTRSLQGTAKHSTQGTSLSDITALMRTKRATNSSKKYIWATARFSHTITRFL